MSTFRYGVRKGIPGMYLVNPPEDEKPDPTESARRARQRRAKERARAKRFSCEDPQWQEPVPSDDNAQS